MSDTEYQEEPKPISLIHTFVVYLHKAASVYLFWILIHYVSLYLYLHFCVPKSWQDILIAPFLISSPHCKALRWAFNYGGTTVDSMWIVLGTWICTKIIISK